MKVAVIGANGFIGRHVVKQLIHQNIETVAVIRKSPHPQIQLGKSVQFVALDVNDATSDSYEILGKPDALIYLAWGGLPFYQSSLHIEKELLMIPRKVDNANFTTLLLPLCPPQTV